MYSKRSEGGAASPGVTWGEGSSPRRRNLRFLFFRMLFDGLSDIVTSLSHNTIETRAIFRIMSDDALVQALKADPVPLLRDN